MKFKQGDIVRTTIKRRDFLKGWIPKNTRGVITGRMLDKTGWLVNFGKMYDMFYADDEIELEV